MARLHERHHHHHLPELQTVKKIKSYPLISYVLGKSKGIYTDVKRSNKLFNYYFCTLEETLDRSLNIAIPVAEIFQPIISVVDVVTYAGLDTIEKAVHNVQEKKEQVKKYVLDKVSTIKEVKMKEIIEGTWNATNAILSTPIGSIAYKGITTYLIVTDKVVDIFLPPFPGEHHKSELQLSRPGIEDKDKLLFAICFVTEIYKKIERRSSHAYKRSKVNFIILIKSLPIVRELRDFSQSVARRASQTSAIHHAKHHPKHNSIHK